MLALKPEDHKHNLCLMCRSVFSDDETKGASACPNCSDEGIPGDTDKSSSLRLTDHEWRIIFMWATNWAEGPCGKENDRAARLMGVLRREAKKQSPDLPALTLSEEVQDAVDSVPGVSKAELISGDHTEFFEKKMKH